MEAFKEERNGQYNFLETLELNTELQNKTISNFIVSVRKEMADLQKIKRKIEKYQNFYSEYLEEANKEFESFIIDYFQQFDFFSYEKILEEYFENYSTDYHNLGKFFLYYLQTFVYKKSKIENLNEELCIRMENFVLMDPIKYRREYLETLEMVHERKKLRVNGYIVYHGKPLLEKISTLTNSKTLSLELHKKVKEMLEDTTYQECIFEQGKEFMEEESEQILSILFLHYLEKCVYYNSFEYPNDNFKKLVVKIENYVVFHLPMAFVLDKKQEKILEMARGEVAKRVANYVKKESPKLFSMLKDYDQLTKFKKANKLKMIEEGTDLSALPKNVSKEEMCFALETFLNIVFQCTISISSSNLPIFLEGYEPERDISLTLALEYLNRFIYKISRTYKIEENTIANLENHIAFCKSFKVNDANLCYAKSILLDRVNRRNVLTTPYTRSLSQKIIAK